MFTLIINTENEAFVTIPGAELVRILRRIAKDLEQSVSTEEDHKVLDINGNTVGMWRLDGDITAVFQEILP